MARMQVDSYLLLRFINEHVSPSNEVCVPSAGTGTHSLGTSTLTNGAVSHRELLLLLGQGVCACPGVLTRATQNWMKLRCPFILNNTAALPLKQLGWVYASVLRAFPAKRYHYNRAVHVSFRGDFVRADPSRSGTKGMLQRTENTEACSNQRLVLSCPQEKK